MLWTKYRYIYITFSVPIKIELDNGKTTSHKLKFIDSCRFMSSSLSSLVDNLSEGLHNKKCGKCKFCLKYISIEDNKLVCKCTDCNKNYKLHFNKDLISSLQTHMNLVIKILINLFCY